MQYIEELLTDERFRQFNEHQQSELIAEHFVGIEDRIRSAPTRLDAMQYKELACTRFEQACPSALLRTALARHVEKLILRYWDKREG
jgi:hypothetical protein